MQASPPRAPARPLWWARSRERRGSQPSSPPREARVCEWNWKQGHYELFLHCLLDLLLLLPPVKVPLAGKPAQATHAVTGNHFRFPRVAGVTRVLGHRHRRSHEAPGSPGLQTLVLLPENPAQRRLQTLLLCGGCGCRSPFLCEKLCGVKGVLNKVEFSEMRIWIFLAALFRSKYLARGCRWQWRRGGVRTVLKTRPKKLIHRKTHTKNVFF